MTEQITEHMAVEHIRNLAGDYKCWDDRISREESLILCKLLDELEQYRTLGTVEEILKEFNIQRDIIATQHETLKEYRNLGTVEELRVARDKQVAKQLFGNESNPIVTGETVSGFCPDCLTKFICITPAFYKANGYGYCKECGQKLDWSDEDE